MKFIDLFAGIGGFRYGLESVSLQQKRTEDPSRGKNNSQQDRNSEYGTGRIRKNQPDFRCVWSNEWDRYASQIYKKHFGECDTRDITKVPSADIPDHDLLVGGFPCQAFSIAGKRKGFEDTRGTLFFEIARILRDKRPRYFLLENVKGLLSHDSGKTFQTILGVLTDLGYEYQWQVLNSKDYGVPQNRERVFIAGHLRGTSRPQIFPLTESYGGDYFGCIQATYHKGWHEGSYPESKESVERGKRKKPFLIHNIYGGFKETEVRRFDKYSPTIRTPKGGGHIPDVVEGIKIRKLTPIECERLQGFPDGWTEGLSDTQRYKCLGNAVTTNVVTEIGKRLLLPSTKTMP